MSLFIKILNNEVKEVWDTQPPAGDIGWKEAIEVTPEIIEGRQVIEGHTFNLDTDPVQIIYGVRDFSISERKEILVDQAKLEFQKVVNDQLQIEMDDSDTSGDLNAVSEAKAVKDVKIVAINTATTHEDLDLIS